MFHCPIPLYGGVCEGHWGSMDTNNTEITLHYAPKEIQHVKVIKGLNFNKNHKAL